jgi:phage-related baseplate assembly protein
MAANPAWTPNATIAPFQVIIDSNGNVQQAGATGGITGLNPPAAWATTIGEITQDNTVQWTCVALIALPAPAVSLPTTTPPRFLVDADGLDVTSIVNDMVSEYENITGRVLQPAQVERLYVNFAAYRESLVRQAIQYTGEQNLLAFANFPALDFLGGLWGIARLPAQPATTVIQFTLGSALTVALTIPQATPIGSADGQTVWLTNEQLTIPAGSTTGTVIATCQTAGTIGNGYLTGEINVLLTPNAQISGITNTVQSNGGADYETDDHLRTRIQAAPNEVSTAGPAATYRFFALSVNPSIIDAEVVSPAPGQVAVYILIGPVTEPAASPNSSAIAGSTLLGQVLAALSADTVRPLTDTVSVYAVTEVDYSITATVTLYADADPTSSEAAAQTAAQLFAQNNSNRVGRDIILSQLVAALMVAGVYEVVLTSPSADIINSTGNGLWANCTSINLTFAIGTEHS